MYQKAREVVDHILYFNSVIIIINMKQKIFNGKTFMISKSLQKLQKFSPSNDLTYMVYIHYYNGHIIKYGST